MLLAAAKAYLQRVRELDAAQRSSDEDEDDGEGGDRHAQLSERLRREALEVSHRADRLTVKNLVYRSSRSRRRTCSNICSDGARLCWAGWMIVISLDSYNPWEAA